MISINSIKLSLNLDATAQQRMPRGGTIRIETVVVDPKAILQPGFPFSEEKEFVAVMVSSYSGTGIG